MLWTPSALLMDWALWGFRVTTLTLRLHWPLQGVRTRLRSWLMPGVIELGTKQLCGPTLPTLSKQLGVPMSSKNDWLKQQRTTTPYIETSRQLRHMLYMRKLPDWKVHKVYLRSWSPQGTRNGLAWVQLQMRQHSLTP